MSSKEGEEGAETNSLILQMHRKAGVSFEDDDFDSVEEVVEGAASD